jgi:hypothetical protein
MSAPFYPVVLTSQRAAGALFNTYTTAKSVLNSTELVPIPGNYLAQGSKLRVRAWGGLSNLVTTPGTVTFQIMMGSIVAWTSGAMQMIATAETLAPFLLEVVLRLDSAGSGTAAKFMGGGFLQALNITLTAGSTVPTTVEGAFAAPATAPTVGTGFDSTITDILDFWVGFSISNAANGVQLYDYTVEQLN